MSMIKQHIFFMKVVGIWRRYTILYFTYDIVAASSSSQSGGEAFMTELYLPRFCAYPVLEVEQSIWFGLAETCQFTFPCNAILPHTGFNKSQVTFQAARDNTGLILIAEVQGHKSYLDIS